MLADVAEALSEPLAAVALEADAVSETRAAAAEAAASEALVVEIAA